VRPRRREALRMEWFDERTVTTAFKTPCFSCNNGCDTSLHVKDGKVIKFEVTRTDGRASSGEAGKDLLRADALEAYR
jgi:hypothetical protein